MRYNYIYSLYATGWNRLACSSWSTFEITVTTLPAVREYVRRILAYRPDNTSIVVVRTLCNDSSSARFYYFNPVTGSLEPTAVLPSLFNISRGSEYLPR